VRKRGRGVVSEMPDSNITKKALAMAMKELMEQIPFSKISVSDICEKCGMNRKSFYYHFKDKYDLVNWIFDVEFFQAVHVRDYNLPNWSWRFLEDSCQYFYENQSFYRKALQIEGQNSFVEHFRETLKPLLKMVVKNILADPQYEEFCINFYSDAFIAALERWLSEKECTEPELFIKMLQSSIGALIKYVETDNG
jgi:probable dihydroxyacetone kinase regulator